MRTIRRYLAVFGFTFIGIVVGIIVLGGTAVGLFALAEHSRGNRLVAGLSIIGGRYLLVGGAVLVTIFFFSAVLGPTLAMRLFFVRDKALTPDVVNDLRAKETAAVTVPIAPGQGVLRVIPVKPDWWLDDAYAEDTAPVITVEDVEHRLPGWEPYDIAVQAGHPEVVAWMPRRSGNPGRRIRNTVAVPPGHIGAAVFRPSAVPELGGTLEPLDSELTGKLSFFRLAVGTALLAGIAYGVWRLADG